MVSLGVVSDGHGLGIEGSGVVRRVGSAVKDVHPGERVVVQGSGLFRTHIVVPAYQCVPIPDNMSLEGAATITVAYVTAVYSLLDVGQLEKGQVRGNLLT